MPAKREPIIMLTVLALTLAAIVFGPVAYRTITADGRLLFNKRTARGDGERLWK